MSNLPHVYKGVKWGSALPWLPVLLASFRFNAPTLEHTSLETLVTAAITGKVFPTRPCYWKVQIPPAMSLRKVENTNALGGPISQTGHPSSMSAATNHTDLTESDLSTSRWIWKMHQFSLWKSGLSQPRVQYTARSHTRSCHQMFSIHAYPTFGDQKRSSNGSP
jgi:hypothetical protein